jgi:hypothetical protein
MIETKRELSVPRAELDSLANGYWLQHRLRTQELYERNGEEWTPELLDLQVARDPFWRAAVAALKPGFLAGEATSLTVAAAIRAEPQGALPPEIERLVCEHRKLFGECALCLCEHDRLRKVCPECKPPADSNDAASVVVGPRPSHVGVQKGVPDVVPSQGFTGEVLECWVMDDSGMMKNPLTGERVPFEELRSRYDRCPL